MKKVMCILLTITLIVTFTGCTSKLKVDENAVRNISNKITESVIKTATSEKAEKTETKTIDATNYNKLVIKNSVGDINIKTHDSNEAIVEVKVKATSNNKEKATELLDNFSYTIDNSLNTIDINTSIKSDRFISPDGIAVDLNIKIPSSVEILEVTSNVGDFKVDGFTGKIEETLNVGNINIINSDASYIIKNNVGDINIKNSKVSDKTELNVNTGSIDVSFTDISNSKTINAQAQVGDIDITLPQNSSYEASIKEFMKKEQVQTLGDGKTKINLVTNVGNIDLK